MFRTLCDNCKHYTSKCDIGLDVSVNALGVASIDGLCLDKHGNTDVHLVLMSIDKNPVDISKLSDTIIRNVNTITICTNTGFEMTKDIEAILKRVRKWQIIKFGESHQEMGYQMMEWGFDKASGGMVVFATSVSIAELLVSKINWASRHVMNYISRDDHLNLSTPAIAYRELGGNNEYPYIMKVLDMEGWEQSCTKITK